MSFVAVAVPAPLWAPLTYRVPPGLEGRVPPGVRVRVPLGSRKVVGVVVGPAAPLGEDVEIKEIQEALDDPDSPALTPDVLGTLLWTADYYLAPPGETIRAALPGAVEPRQKVQVKLTEAGKLAAQIPGAPPALAWLAGRPGAKATRQSFLARLEKERDLKKIQAAGFLETDLETGPARGAAPLQRLVEPAPAVRLDPQATLSSLARTPARKKVLERALQEGPLPPAQLARAAGAGLAAVNGLVAAGVLVESSAPIPAPVLPDPGFPALAPPEITPDQAAAVGRVCTLLDAGRFQPVVLFGVTGSGKTEVYLRAAEHALAASRPVLFLVPEIGLTPQLASTLGIRFGDEVVVMHSGLGERQRFEGWEKARRGAARIVVGARSALFAPLVRPGLIVVDEEHDSGYKQEETPRYHARDLALVRGREAGAVVLLGSATPSMEAWNLAATGRAELLRLPRRVSGADLAAVELVDMREEFRRTGQDHPLSQRLRTALREVVERGEQAMVLLNRRGYTRVMLCRQCGEAVGCRACSIALTWHQVGQKLMCHYCGATRGRPAACPACGSPHLHDFGSGTQRAEEELARALPGAAVARLDRDVIRSPQRLAAILGDFACGRTQVLVGTQMIAKGHHFPKVTLVGVLSADAALRMPDFRAAERTFQLLTQVSGRAGRGDLPGRVIIQAFRPDHPALQASLTQDFEAFAARELPARQVLRYPPAAALANLVVRHKDQTTAFERAREVAERLKAAGEEKVAVLGPTSAPLARLQELWRVQILVRAVKRRRVTETIRRALWNERGEPALDLAGLIIDIDPYQLL